MALERNHSQRAHVCKESTVEPIELRMHAARRIVLGELPSPRPGPFYAVSGESSACDLCRGVIGPDQVTVRLRRSRPDVMRFHCDCFAAYNRAVIDDLRERFQLSRSATGYEANLAVTGAEDGEVRDSA
jgi:hypothetical protein